MKATTLARWDRRIRPFLTRLPAKKVVSLYSKGRVDFLKKLTEEPAPEAYIPDKRLERVLWSLKFRGPLMNAAGMFKNGECYELVSNEGAAAYLGGTGVWNKRLGNEKDNIPLPFVPYPLSHASSNWLGLPGDGDEENLKRIPKDRINGCLYGWSEMGSPNLEGDEKLEKLVKGVRLYYDAGVDFTEENESCPNTQHGKPQDDGLVQRLRYMGENYLKRRERGCPMIVKFSTDTPIDKMPYIMDLLFEFGFDGVNFGNTSTNYEKRRDAIHPKEQALYDFFTTDKENFGVGGGLGGRILKDDSLMLCAAAVEYLKAGRPKQEFHVFRTGGVENTKDIIESDQAGVSMNQWFTGRWEAFAEHGYDSYKVLHEHYLGLKMNEQNRRHVGISY